MLKHEQWMKVLVAETEAASGILLPKPLPATMPGWAIRTRKNAHAHLYAAMAFDFLRKAEGEIPGVERIRMNDGNIKTPREFIAESMIGGMLDKLDVLDPDTGFAVTVRDKFNRLMAATSLAPEAGA